MVTIQFQYAHGEYARALRRYRLRNFRVGRDLGIAAFVVVAAYMIQGLSWPFWFAAGAAAFYVFVATLSTVIYPALVPRWRTHLKEPYRLVFSDSGIAFSTPSTKSTLPWSIYRTWSRDTEYVYLSLGRGHATVLPRRALSAPGAESALLQLFAQKLGSEKTT